MQFSDNIHYFPAHRQAGVPVLPLRILEIGDTDAPIDLHSVYAENAQYDEACDEDRELREIILGWVGLGVMLLAAACMGFALAVQF